MPLPGLDPAGLLPRLPTPRHQAETAELKQAFVTTAPSHQALRGRQWLAFLLWADRVRHHFGPSVVWLGGSFVTHRIQDPELYLAVFPSTPSMVSTAVAAGSAGLSLVTTEDLFFMAPPPGGSLNVLRPVGGLLDAALGQPQDMAGWEAMFGAVMDRGGRTYTEAGFVEVRV